MKGLASPPLSRPTQLKWRREPQEDVSAAHLAASLEARLAEVEMERDELWHRVLHLERLAQAGMMAGGLVHDTGNMLAAISGNSQLALATLPAETSNVHLTQSVELCRRAHAGLKAYLLFAKGHLRGASTCAVGDVLVDAGRFLSPTLKRGKVTLSVHAEGALSAACEPTLLLQAIVNLLLNAVKAIGDADGRIELSGRLHQDFVEIDVKDDGPGVPEHVRARLFQPFATAPGSREGGSGGGTGLGLYVTRRILEEQGGSISLVDAGPGACFRMRVPRVAPQDSTRSATAPRKEVVCG